MLDQKSQTTNQTPDITSQANNTRIERSQSLNHDQKMVQLEKQIPGLGGLFIDESGQLSIYLTQPANQRAQAAAIFQALNLLPKRWLVQEFKDKNIVRLLSPTCGLNKANIRLPSFTHGEKRQLTNCSRWMGSTQSILMNPTINCPLGLRTKT